MAKIKTIQLYRGLKANKPATGLNAGEPLITTDTQEIFIAKDASTSFSPTPDIESFTSIGTADPAADTLLIYDASATAGTPKARKITLNEVKAAMNIPASDSDEKVAIISGGAAGYLGSDGTDGVLRAGTGITMTKDASNGFVTIAAAALTVIDGGTF